MEIKLNTGDKITIPEDCEATIEGNQIIIKKQEGFKDGDILISKDSKYSKYFVIFKSYDKTTKFAFNSYFNSVDILNFYWFTEGFRLATEKEKQEFFDELKAKGLKWNAETKQIEKIRRRANKGEKFIFINALGGVDSTKEQNREIDDALWKASNYYLPNEKEQAIKDAERIRAIFKERTKLR